MRQEAGAPQGKAKVRKLMKFPHNLSVIPAMMTFPKSTYNSKGSTKLAFL